MKKTYRVYADGRLFTVVRSAKLAGLIVNKLTADGYFAEYE